MLVWLFLTFAILIFFMALITAVMSGLATMLFIKKKELFLDVFKPGFIAGSTGIFLILLMGYIFDAGTTNVSNFDLLWFAPVVLSCIGVCVGTIRSYQKINDNVKT